MEETIIGFDAGVQGQPGPRGTKLLLLLLLLPAAVGAAALTHRQTGEIPIDGVRDIES